MNHISKALRGVADKYNGVSLIIRIIVGLIAGTALALVVPHMTWIGEFGTLFVSALKAVAPILVFVLVASALAQGNSKLDGRFGTVLFLYLFTTFLSAVVAVLTSRMFPQTISLGDAADADVVPQGLSEVVQTLLTNIVANPIQAMIDGNYICILMWACLFGLAMKGIANESSKAFLANVADGVSQVIRWVINLAPFGIMGLVFTSVSENGLAAFTEYGSLLLLLVGTMLLMVLVFGPLVIFLYLHHNPYPLVYRCFKESGHWNKQQRATGHTGSAACAERRHHRQQNGGRQRNLNAHRIGGGHGHDGDGDGGTVHVDGCAQRNGHGIHVFIKTKLLAQLHVDRNVRSSNDIAMQVVGVGFIIGVIQDSVETCLNSASDVEFAATAEYHAWLKQGRQLPAFMYSKKERQQLGIEA